MEEGGRSGGAGARTGVHGTAMAGRDATCKVPEAPQLLRMNATRSSTSKAPHAGLDIAERLAHLLERLDRSAVPVGADQYRSVVMHLVHEFADVESGPELGQLLDRYPAAAELYENVNYAHAGLCRTSLDVSLAAEMQARDVLARAMRRAGDADHRDATDVQG